MSPNHPANPIRILFVEDSEHDFRAFCRAFQKSDVSHEITHYERAEDALERLKTDAASFDLVVTDYKLLGMSGLDLFKASRQAKIMLPMVMLTGSGSEQLAVEALKAGVDDYLVKDPDQGYLNLLPMVLINVMRKYEDQMARKRAEEALAESRKFLDKFMNAVTDPIFVKDRQHRWVLINDSYCRFFGYEREKLIGKSNYDFFPKDEADTCWIQDEVVFTSGMENSNEEKVTDAKGVTHTILTKKTPYEDEKGDVFIVGIIRDISEYKKLEVELLKAQKLESVGLLAGGIAHDFNNVLTAILGNISLARILLSPQDKAYKHLTSAEKATSKARYLSQRLIIFAEGGAPVRKKISANDLIRDTAGLASSGSNVICEFDIADHLWSVYVDEGQIGQAINNIVVNAVQAMPGGGKIVVRCENTQISEGDTLPLPPGRYVKIGIKDQGTGISEECIDKIFDPYFTTNEQGRGLGLATVYSILKNHEGHITVDSQEGSGTTFTLYLPTFESQAAMIDPDQEQPVSGAGKILVMDDEDVVRQTAEAMLNHLGYEAALARDGAQAIDMYADALQSDRPFDVVIMDLTIPGGMGGKEAIIKLKDMDPKVKVLVSSGYSHDPIISNYGEYGFSGAVLKPYGIAELSKQIRKVLQEEGPDT